MVDFVTWAGQSLRTSSLMRDMNRKKDSDFDTWGGGGTSILTVTGMCRWTGYDFHGHPYLHRISKLATGGLLRLSQECFPGFPARFTAHNVYDRLAISAPATARAGRNRFLWIHNDDTQQNRESVRTCTGYRMHMKVLVRYIVHDRVYFCVRRAVWDRVRFSPPPPSKWESSAPPPPGFWHIDWFYLPFS